MYRPTAIGLSPNVEVKDSIVAIKLFLNPFSWMSNRQSEKLKEWFQNYFQTRYSFSFNSGRSALFALLKSASVEKDDEVILQAFTCVAVPNAVVALGAKPIYVDIDASLTMDANDLKKKITKKTKAIIFQYTFGMPGNIQTVVNIAKENNITLIEDVAHTIGGTFAEKKLGTIGDGAIFSFGRDKAFSSVFGGIAITDSKEIGEKLALYYKTIKAPNALWTLQQLFHPIAFLLILPLYNLFVGKFLLVLLQRLRLLSFPVSDKDKKSQGVEEFVLKMPDPLAKLALLQLDRLEKFNSHRKKLASMYVKSLPKEFDLPSTEILPYLRFPILVKEKQKLIRFFQSKGITLGTWYSSVIDPKGVAFKAVFYTEGTCPVAEKTTEQIVNLPTYPTCSEKEAATIVQLLREYDN